MYKNYRKERCTSHAIGWKTLNQLVLEDIRLNAQAAQLAAKDYMDMLIAAKTQTMNNYNQKSSPLPMENAEASVRMEGYNIATPLLNAPG